MCVCVCVCVCARAHAHVQDLEHDCSASHSRAGVQVHNEKGKNRVVVTKDLPGERWLEVLKKADCRVEVCREEATILDNATITKLIGDDCIGVLGQLTEVCAVALQDNLLWRGPVACGLAGAVVELASAKALCPGLQLVTGCQQVAVHGIDCITAALATYQRSHTPLPAYRTGARSCLAR